MIRDLVWACVVCRTEGGLDANTQKGRARCRVCGAAYRRGRGATIVVSPSGTETETVYTAREIVALLGDPGISGSAHCTVRESTGDKPLYALGRYLGRIEQLGPARPGTLALKNGRLRFTPEDGEGFDIPLLSVSALQPSSHALQVKTTGRPVFSIKFTESSSKLWEERLQAAIQTEYHRTGRADIAEFQPRICTKRVVAKDTRSFRARRRIEEARDKRPERPRLYRFCCWLARALWKGFGGSTDVQGLEHIPKTGPFILISNHQSFLETMLIPAVIDRPIHAMAKSTQFNVPLFGWLMAKVFAFPVRRFEIDPQTVRYVLRRLSEGYGILLFPEGERTWTGELEPARLGVVRLALKANVPIVPTRVEGAFDAWPRWSKVPQRRLVRITFGAPLMLSGTNTRAEREAQLQESVRLIRDAITV
ncbi:MAG: lysophospholipid acyltransferase family protein [Gemmatimonadota bacterium]